MIKNTKQKLFILVTIFIMFAASLLAQESCQIQVFASKDEAKANEIATKINEIGCGDAQITNNNGMFKVFSKTYDTYADANFAKIKIKSAGFTDAFIVKNESAKKAATKDIFGDTSALKNEKSEKSIPIDFKSEKSDEKVIVVENDDTQFDIKTADEKDVFKRAILAYKKNDIKKTIECLDGYIGRFQAGEKIVDAKLMKAYCFIKLNDKESAKKQFETVINEHPKSELAGEAALRCAYLSGKNILDSTAQLEKFNLVASGKVNAKKEIRIEAMLRSAALYHRGKDREMSEKAYEIIEQTADDKEVKAFAAMQRAGIMLEYAYDGKKTYEEARAACEKVISTYPDVNKQTRATASLMAIETLAHEEKNQEVIGRSEKYLKDFEGTPEEQLALYWFARAYYKMGDENTAKALLAEIKNADPETIRRFDKADVNAASKRLEIMIKEEGKPNLAQK